MEAEMVDSKQRTRRTAILTTMGVLVSLTAAVASSARSVVASPCCYQAIPGDRYAPLSRAGADRVARIARIRVRKTRNVFVWVWARYVMASLRVLG